MRVAVSLALVGARMERLNGQPNVPNLVIGARTGSAGEMATSEHRERREHLEAEREPAWA